MVAGDAKEVAVALDISLHLQALDRVQVEVMSRLQGIIE